MMSEQTRRSPETPAPLHSTGGGVGGGGVSLRSAVSMNAGGVITAARRPAAALTQICFTAHASPERHSTPIFSQVTTTCACLHGREHIRDENVSVHELNGVSDP